MAKRQAVPHGILIVDKPSGPTSHDVVAQARRHFGTRRVGHGGTLDPMATGVLVLLFGEATKLSDVLTHGNKRYAAEVSLGRATDSHDADGVTTLTYEGVAECSEQALEAALELERGRELQVPPVVSALKVGGRRAHSLNRAGTPPELAPRPVRVHELRLLGTSGPHIRLELSVTKGYYVRSLARDLGEALGIPAHLSQLRRLESGSFSVSEAVAWPPGPEVALVPLTTALPRLLPIARLTEAGVLRARRGQLLSADDFVEAPAPPPASATSAPALCGWTDALGNLIALGRSDPDGFRVRRGFVDNEEFVPSASTKILDQ
jgi:tRNA pseudouridine55 synthase